MTELPKAISRNAQVIAEPDIYPKDKLLTLIYIQCFSKFRIIYFIIICTIGLIMETGNIFADNTNTLLYTPAVTVRLPLIILLYPILATSYGFITNNLNNTVLSILAFSANIVFVAPGQRQVIVTPVPLSS